MSNKVFSNIKKEPYRPGSAASMESLGNKGRFCTKTLYKIYGETY